jgi:hypothetical protein
MREKMGIHDKIKTIFKSSKEKFKSSKRVLLCSSAVLFLFLILAASTAHYILPVEARSEADFNVRSTDSLASYVQKWQITTLKFNVFTNSTGLYELKVYPPGGRLVFTSINWIGKGVQDRWTANYPVETKEFGQYDAELLGLSNNQSYTTSFWIEDLSKKQKIIPGPSVSQDKTSPAAVNNSSVSQNLTNNEGSKGSGPFGNSSSEAVKGDGSLYINSIPIGSTIYLNGRELGATPLTVENISVGNHSLMLALAGYETFSTKVEVVAGKNTFIYQNLEKTKPLEASEDAPDKSPIALLIKAFIVFLIGGMIVYILIGVLIKDKKKEKQSEEDLYVTIEELLKEEKKERNKKRDQ